MIPGLRFLHNIAYTYTYVCIYIKEREKGKDRFKYWLVRVLPNCMEKEAWRELEKNPKATNFQRDF